MAHKLKELEDKMSDESKALSDELYKEEMVSIKQEYSKEPIGGWQEREKEDTLEDWCEVILECGRKRRLEESQEKNCKRDPQVSEEEEI